MKNKIKKGDYGYRNAHRKKQLAVIGMFLAVIAALLISRNFMEPGNIRNLTTITAILVVLPMANAASPVVAAWKIKETSKSLYEACRPYEKKFPVLYDLIITSTDLILPMDVAVIHPSGVYFYCSKKNIKQKDAEHFINEMLVNWKLDGNAKVLTEEKNFLRRLESLKPVTEEEDDGSAPHVEKLLKSLSM